MRPLNRTTKLLTLLGIFAASACGSGGSGGSSATGSGGSGGHFGNAGNGGSSTSAGAGANTGAGAASGGATSTTAGTGAGLAGSVSGGSGGDATSGGTAGVLGNAGASGVAGGTGTDGRVRSITPFDSNWLFTKGDPAGAQQAAFADSGFRALDVPHDWAIEGPFAETNPTTGRGAYAPSGVAWYRKHFSLGAALSKRKIYLEFDGVMGNSDVYVNGTLIGHHPYGYASLRYDISGSVQFGGADNVVAVKTDTSVQPASRFYAGAGIYRHVRLIAADPVHVAQYGTVVTTPAPTASSATVHVATMVTNSGAITESIALTGIVKDPSGNPLAPVSSAAQSIAAGASTTFSIDVPVPNPKLWDLEHPNLYTLTVQVQAGATTLDDDLVTFGIRELKFNAGMTLNGKSVKFQGVANHQDYHALGLAAPQRAIQRRLAQLKALGVNAIRTAHEPPSPDLLELTDRMGFLVLDEFTDVWTGHKYADVGDYSAYFNKVATMPTGEPAVPGVTTGATWWQVDLAGYIMRDRNHPSVALYSLGNEIHDSINTRTPILTKMIAISHALDPSRPDTQALLQPGTSGDVGGPTNSLLDVWGDNYHVPECLQAMPSSPTKSGLLTEMGSETSTWTTVTANPALTGEFIWTGVDYLGEADGAWPTIGSTAGIMDALGGVKAIGYAWQKTWGAPKTSAPPTGTTASKLVVSADHASVFTDGNDIVFFAAQVSDAAGHVVPSSNAPISFELSGPGKIVAVDSASMKQESFRGTARNAFNGVAYALVQATGTGKITVSASSTGLGSASASTQATAGTFIPCSGSCD